VSVNRVAVEKLGFPGNWLKTDDQKCIRIRRKSFIGHPGATIFLRDLGEGVFQQLRLFTTVIVSGTPRSGQNEHPG
jgi:hypothetical protein